MDSTVADEAEGHRQGERLVRVEAPVAIAEVHSRACARTLGGGICRPCSRRATGVPPGRSAAAAAVAVTGGTSRKPRVAAVLS